MNMSRAGLHTPSHSSLAPATQVPLSAKERKTLQLIGGVAIDYCIVIERTDLLFSEVRLVCEELARPCVLC